jgi:hypothetical protein
MHTNRRRTKSLARERYDASCGKFRTDRESSEPSCHGKIEVLVIASRSDGVRCGAFAVSEAVSAVAKFRHCLEAKASFMLDALPND